MCSIVIVEDEDLERRFLRTVLEKSIPGAQVLGEARSGLEAIKLIDRYNIDLILVDINIPVVNGFEVIRHLRQKHTDTKVIITTAYDAFEMTREAIHLKADEYLLKPIRPDVLVRTVKMALQNGVGKETQQRCDETIHRLGFLLEQDSYREAVELVLGHVEWLYTQKELSTQQMTKNFAGALLALAKDRNMPCQEPLHQQMERMKAIRPEDQFRMADIFQKMTDLLFDAAREEFGHSEDTMRRALNYIERNLRKGVKLEEVAEHINISSYYLSKLFKKNLHINFISYVTNRRMELAKKYLSSTEMPVSNIALELSYSDPNYFCKSFKKEVSMSPSEYRKWFAAENAKEIQRE